MDTYDFLTDPRTLTMVERQATRDRYASEQNAWLERLRPLAEETRIDDDFPAFLLATRPFAELADRVGRAQRRSELPADVADELDWFLRAFADYLRTQDGEDTFGEARRRTG